MSTMSAMVSITMARHLPDKTRKVLIVGDWHNIIRSMYSLKYIVISTRTYGF